jgi:5'-nucleotidase (lipoprotein e(P4) family)
MSVLWFQKSAEMRALFVQGYNIAREKLIEANSVRGADKPLAVVADIDETILDNSPFEGWQITTGNAFSDSTWTRWTDMAVAKALPGALEFARLADSLGVEIFYVSNRTVSDALESTITNLKSAGFPYADREHILLKDDTSSKISRRKKILETHDIILLIGDNLGDLDGIFENRDRNFGFDSVDSLSGYFGEKFIILPNPMYGTWEKPAIITGEGMTLRERLKKSVTSLNP